jgi:hypothetical protein
MEDCVRCVSWPNETCQIDGLVLLLNECLANVLAVGASDELCDHHAVDKGITGLSMSINVHCLTEHDIVSSLCLQV